MATYNKEVICCIYSTYLILRTYLGYQNISSTQSYHHTENLIPSVHHVSGDTRRAGPSRRKNLIISPPPITSHKALTERASPEKPLRKLQFILRFLRLPHRTKWTRVQLILASFYGLHTKEKGFCDRKDAGNTFFFLRKSSLLFVPTPYPNRALKWNSTTLGPRSFFN